jgi:hypothetical protein
MFLMDHKGLLNQAIATWKWRSATVMAQVLIPQGIK